MESVGTMSKPKTTPPPVHISKDRLSAVIENGPDKPQLPSGFTLRVKPDRRRVQLPMPAEMDRRRPR
jgi:hypothetical protein